MKANYFFLTRNKYLLIFKCTGYILRKEIALHARAVMPGKLGGTSSLSDFRLDKNEPPR